MRVLVQFPVGLSILVDIHGSHHSVAVAFGDERGTYSATGEDSCGCTPLLRARSDRR
jgi:hypothetical protein